MKLCGFKMRSKALDVLPDALETVFAALSVTLRGAVDQTNLSPPPSGPLSGGTGGNFRTLADTLPSQPAVGPSSARRSFASPHYAPSTGLSVSPGLKTVSRTLFARFGLRCVRRTRALLSFEIRPSHMPHASYHQQPPFSSTSLEPLARRLARHSHPMLILGLCASPQGHRAHGHPRPLRVRH